MSVMAPLTSIHGQPHNYMLDIQIEDIVILLVYMLEGDQKEVSSGNCTVI